MTDPLAKGNIAKRSLLHVVCYSSVEVFATDNVFRYKLERASQTGLVTCVEP